MEPKTTWNTRPVEDALIQACDDLVKFIDNGNWRDNRLTDYLNEARAALALARGEVTK
jgi:hypothetical protein